MAINFGKTIFAQCVELGGTPEEVSLSDRDFVKKTAHFRVTIRANCQSESVAEPTASIRLRVRCGSLSESVVQLTVSKRAVGIGRVNVLDNIAAHRISEVKRSRASIYSRR